MTLLNRYHVRDWPRAIVSYLGDAGHRRFVAMAVALAATHLIGKAVDADSVANVIEVVIGGVGGMWNRNSVQAPAEAANGADKPVTVEPTS